MAEGAFRASAQRRGLDCLVDSAGTAAYHVGNPPDPRAIATAAANGIDIAGQRARQIDRDDFFRFTHIVALDRANLEGVRARAPRDATARLSLMMDAVDGRRGDGVADPYHGDAETFAATWEIISLGVDAWVRRLINEGADLKV
jgi:protein-tyrosine phosphatase